jgi:type II pantothenate kinase
MYISVYYDHTLYQFAQKAVLSQPSKVDAEKRATRFKEKYLNRLKELEQNPWLVKVLSGTMASADFILLMQ